MNKKVKKKKKRRINFKKTFVFLLGSYLLISLIFNLFNLPIKNIYIHNNEILSDQEIIEMAKISNYPSTFRNLSPIIQKRVEEDIYVKSANVYKKLLTEVHIDVVENKPLLYNKSINKTVLLDGQVVDKEFIVPTLINYVPDTKYIELIKKIGKIDDDILIRISEIQYDPNEVEDNRFLLYMNDGNYVYITLDRFDSLNSYIEIIKKFENKKGILYLDYGNSFTIIEQ